MARPLASWPRSFEIFRKAIDMHAQVTPEDSRLLHSIPPARVALIERIAQAAPGAGKSAKAQNNLQQRFVRCLGHELRSKIRAFLHLR